MDKNLFKKSNDGQGGASRGDAIPAEYIIVVACSRRGMAEK
jgi:hypothetical protein